MQTLSLRPLVAAASLSLASCAFSPRPDQSTTWDPSVGRDMREHSQGDTIAADFRHGQKFTTYFSHRFTTRREADGSVSTIFIASGLGQEPYVINVTERLKTAPNTPIAIPLFQQVDNGVPSSTALMVTPENLLMRRAIGEVRTSR